MELIFRQNQARENPECVDLSYSAVKDLIHPSCTLNTLHENGTKGKKCLNIYFIIIILPNVFER